MTDLEGFFLGKQFDLTKGVALDKPVTYDPADLTTHAIVTGMTGSGKTGLCIALMEEAALKGIPALIVDPKGDLTNLLLHFPDLLPKDFEPWIDPEIARRANQSVTQAGEAAAANWKKGLESWNLGKEQLQALKESVDFTVFTPGSSAGESINILSSFEAPALPWEENKEILREKIASIITALLGLVGLKDIDPLRSREHILLSNLLEEAWSHGQGLDMPTLIIQTQKPPFDRLGAFPVDTFFPEKDRMELAMLLNSFLASPSFETWQEGAPLDIQQLLFTTEGKPRHSIFYLAHLDDNERMFFVTLLFTAMESWMFTQRGTGTLRALLYFDEILGYLPPIARPPSHAPMLRLLKQARAFGVGLLLATQNPVDVDYKALSNAGTWLIGRLQTDQDKQRLLDGLQGASGNFDRAMADKVISGLGKRVFLLHNVHSKAPVVMTSRWALNFLAGPLTRTQIPALNILAGKEKSDEPAGQASSKSSSAIPQAAAAVAAVNKSGEASSARPALPGGVDEYFLQGEGGGQGLVYQPGLILQAQVRYFSKQYGVNQILRKTAMIKELPQGMPDWKSYETGEMDPTRLLRAPVEGVKFLPLPAWLATRKKIDELRKDFSDWIYRQGSITVFTNEPLKLASIPGETRDEFLSRCKEAAARQGSIADAKQKNEFERKSLPLRQRIRDQQLKIQKLESQANSRQLEMVAKGGEVLLGLFGGRKRSISSGVSKYRMAEQAVANLKDAKQDLVSFEEQLRLLEQSYQANNVTGAEIATLIIEVPISPQQKDIYMELTGVYWELQS
jgi:hypothetical protein